jgi:cobalt/nickel transport system permease protein
MHIPDGFLSARVAGTAGLVSLAGLGFALRQVRWHLPPRRVPLLGLAAAFVFAAQMLNFPIAAGTSGHLLGAALAAALLGPSAAVVVLASVLLVQCFLFADGGALALGANIFNMALVGGAGGYAIFRAVQRWAGGLRGTVFAAAFASWCSVVLAAVACAGQLAASGTAPWRAVFPAMAGVHMAIGAGEAIITALVLVAVGRLRRELLVPAPATPARRYGEFAVYGMLIALGLALFVAPVASSWPDGLEKVAAALGFESRAATSPVLSVPFADYRIPLFGTSPRATAAAGCIGTVAAFALAAALARTLVPREPRRAAHPEV